MPVPSRTAVASGRLIMRTLSKVLTVSSIALFGFAGFAGCGDSSASKMCNALAKKAEQCSDDKDDKDSSKSGAMIAACVAMVEKDPEIKAEVAGSYECTKKESCDEFKQCEKDRRQKRRLDKLVKGKPSKIEDDCRYLDKKMITPEVTKACSAALAHNITEASKEGAKVKCWELKRLTKRYGNDEQKKKTESICAKAESAKALAKLKENADDPAKLAQQCSYTSEKKFTDDVKKLCASALTHYETKIKKATASGEKLKYDVCYRANSLAKKFGAKREAEMKEVCGASKAAVEIKKAMDKAAASITDGKGQIPYECRWALRTLNKLKDSDWKKAQATALIKKCYVDAALPMILKRDSKYRCDYMVRTWLETASKHKLLATHPELLKALQKHQKCEKQIQTALKP